MKYETLDQAVETYQLLLVLGPVLAQSSQPTAQTVLQQRLTAAVVDAVRYGDDAAAGFVGALRQRVGNLLDYVNPEKLVLQVAGGGACNVSWRRVEGVTPARQRAAFNEALGAVLALAVPVVDATQPTKTYLTPADVEQGFAVSVRAAYWPMLLLSVLRVRPIKQPQLAGALDKRFARDPDLGNEREQWRRRLCTTF